MLRGRLRCCYPFDAGSTKLHCGTFGGGAGCTPGRRVASAVSLGPWPTPLLTARFPGCGDRDYAQREARPWGFEGDARAYKPDELAKCFPEWGGLDDSLSSSACVCV